jgi:hypothetical protein
MVRVRPRAHCAKAKVIREYELAIGTFQQERVGALMLTCGCDSRIPCLRQASRHHTPRHTNSSLPP